MHMLFKAIKLVKFKYPDVKLIVPGIENKPKYKNGYLNYLSNLKSKLGLKDNVCYVGNIDADEIIKKMQSSSVCVVSSAMEGASATIREAMFLGVPCIASARGGMTNLIDNEINGYTYDYYDYKTLSNLIISLFEDEKKARSFSEKSIKFSEKMHDRETNYNKLIEIYKELLN